MSLAENRSAITLNLKFHDGGGMTYTFVPGTLQYNSRTGLIVTFELDMKDGSRKHIGLVPRSRTLGVAANVAGFLAPFGLTRAAGSKFRSIAGENFYKSFGAFLLVAAGSAAVVAYLKNLETMDSSYFTLDDDHELCIREPMYVRV